MTWNQTLIIHNARSATPLHQTTKPSFYTYWLNNKEEIINILLQRQLLPSWCTQHTILVRYMRSCIHQHIIIKCIKRNHSLYKMLPSANSHLPSNETYIYITCIDIPVTCAGETHRLLINLAHAWTEVGTVTHDKDAWGVPPKTVPPKQNTKERFHHSSNVPLQQSNHSAWITFLEVHRTSPTKQPTCKHEGKRDQTTKYDWLRL